MHDFADFARSKAKSDDVLTVPLCLVLAVAALCWLVFSYGYIEDDAFIHLEFARSLAEGHGFSFNGRVVNGDTAPLWVVLLTAVHTIGIGWIAAAKFLCGIGVVIALSGVWRVASDISGTAASRERHFAATALTLTALNPYFVHWSFSGMEAVTALGVSLWAIWTVFSSTPPSWNRLAIGAILLSIAPLLRPELLLLSAMAGAALLYRASALPTTRARRVVAVMSLAIAMALPIILWSAYAFGSFGSILPNTNAAKRGGDLISVTTKLATVYLLGFTGTIALVPFVAKRLLQPAVPAAIWVLLLWPLACAVFYIADHSAVQTRYCVLSLPSLTIAVLWLLEESAGAVWARRVVVAIIVANLGVLAAIVYPHVSNKIKLVKTLSIADAYIRDNLPPEAPIAAYAIGQLAFETRHPLIDISGITRPDVLSYTGDLPETIRWAKYQGARFYIGGDSPEPTAVRVYSYAMPFLGWSFRRSNYETSTEIGMYRLP
jgi:hypothetical protein